MFCSNCGNRLADNDAFCGNCGQPVAKEEVTETSVTAAEPSVTATASTGEASGNAVEKQTDSDSSSKKTLKKSKYKWNVDMGVSMIVLAVLYSFRGWFYVFGEPYWLISLNTKDRLYKNWSYLKGADLFYGIACTILVFVCVFAGVALLKKEKVAPKALSTCHIVCFIVGLAYMILINFVIYYRGIDVSYGYNKGMFTITDSGNEFTELMAIKRTALFMTQYYVFLLHIPMFFVNKHLSKKHKDIFVN